MKEKAAAAVIDTTLIDALTPPLRVRVGSQVRDVVGAVRERHPPPAAPFTRMLEASCSCELERTTGVWEQTCFISTLPSTSGAVASTVRGGRRAHPAQEQRSRGEETASLPTGPLCVTKFGKNMDPSQSFHVCSQLPAEKAKGSLPGKPVWLLRQPVDTEQSKIRPGFRKNSCLPSKQLGSTQTWYIIHKDEEPMVYRHPCSWSSGCELAWTNQMHLMRLQFTPKILILVSRHCSSTFNANELPVVLVDPRGQFMIPGPHPLTSAESLCGSP
ncbi:uncharacterized protein LOC111547851 [Piliocolobus tephrosceles]|uniref:uncharacterized protein LOC111547851 n=1 Tax=Piliocolobus tephrosceles TaxID=591936 RepID=UPI000E6B15FB|nr:uncharacterized protein LOC111547851 [Piliocolobus tephrosceles]